MAAGEIRKQIRSAIKDLLEGDSSYPGDVEIGKHYMPQVSEMPLTRIRTPDTERVKNNGDEMDLFIDVELEQWAAESADTSVDDALDLMGDLAEDLLMDSTETLGGLVFRVLPGPQSQQIDDTADNVYGVLISLYTLQVIK